MKSNTKQKLFTPAEKKGILGLSLIFFFRMFGLFLILPVFSVLATEELTYATPLLVGLAMGAYGLTSALLQIPFGAWSDRAGRKKVLTIGILLFVIGSAMAALSDNIYMMIAARLLQGAGAISSPIFALIADLTRPEVRARANAGLGASVGLSFGVAMVSAPLLAAWIGLSGIFWVIAGMASTGLVLLWVVVPDPEEEPQRATASLKVMLGQVLAQPPLMTINIGALVISMGLSATFFQLPLLLKAEGWVKTDYWMIYLSLLGAGGLTMLPAVFFAEAKNKFKQVMTGGALAIFASWLVLAWGWPNRDFTVMMVSIFMFFMAFNIFEPIFPSLVTRFSGPETKGTASGVYNFSQFIGQFLGGVLAGFLYQTSGPVLAAVMTAATVLFLWRCLNFENPEPRRSATEEAPPETAPLVTEGE